MNSQKMPHLSLKILQPIRHWRLLLAQHCQLSMVVDEFGSVVGVLALEDIIENILGKEIFEHDDPAVDMRELAKQKHHSQSQKDRNT